MYALREEGDVKQGDVHSTVVVISIHALREEGDLMPDTFSFD